MPAMTEPTAQRRHVVLSLSAGPETVPAARHFAMSYLAQWPLRPDVRDDAELMVSELVTNALRHGPPPIYLDVSLRGNRIRISVADSSRVAPQAMAATTWSEGGRGLALLQAVAADWGSEMASSGKRVWCELPVSE